MFRRLTPLMLTLLAVILDTTILPIVYTGVYNVPLTMVTVLLIGMLLGKTNGLLYGTLGGLLIDISAGTLGVMTFYFIAAGFMMGLILHNPNERPALSYRQVRRRRFNLTVWPFAVYGVGELVLFFVQYFNTAQIQSVYFLNILIRCVICTALTLILRPVFFSIMIGRKRASTSGRTREVKSY